MTTACRCLHRFTAIVVVGLATGIVNSASGQGSDNELAACASIESESNRLACYDNVLRPAGEPEPAPAVRVEPQPTPAVRVEPEPTPAARAAPEPVPTPAPAPAPVAIEEPGSIVVDAPIRLPREPSLSERRRAEREAARRAREEAGDVDVLIVSSQKNLSGLLVLRTEAGDVLEQISVRDVRFGDPPYAARLSPASSGSYFLSVEGLAARIRVRLRN